MTSSGNHCCSGEVKSISYSECVFVALFIQNAMPMRRIILLSVAYYHYETMKKKQLLDVKCGF